jgi:16S rRNA (uracil1498-N3)-methyltransferase
MHRFFVSSDNIRPPEIFITNLDVNHIKNVLRLIKGDEIVVCDSFGNEYHAKIIGIEKDKIRLEIVEKFLDRNIYLPQITLFQSLPKSSKMDLIIKQTTELGILRVVPLITERTIVKLDSVGLRNRLDRWRKIAVEASKQSQRNTIPEISDSINFASAEDVFKEFDLILTPWEKEKETTLKEILSKGGFENIGIVIGPEGGFSEEEIKKLLSFNAKTITLGRNILRTETAGIVVLAITLYELDCLGK